MSWNTIIGQERPKKKIISILEQARLGHAYLFVGPDGVGKDGIANELAKVVLCTQKTDFQACDQCPNCLQANAFHHPNIHHIFALPVGKNETDDDSPIDKLSSDDLSAVQEQLQKKSQDAYHDFVIPRANIIKVSSVRELKRQSSLSSFGYGMKVFIVYEAEKMNDPSANALLKTLEEPLPNTLIILISSHLDQLKSTVISRCQLVRFEYLEENQITQALRERQNIAEQEARSVARMANGSYSRAQELLKDDFLKLRKDAVDFIRTMLFKPRADLVKQIEDVHSSFDKQEVDKLLTLMLAWLRDTMTIRSGEQHVVNVDDIVAIKKFSEVCIGIDYEKLFIAIERAISLLYKNVYIPLILLNLAIELRSIILPTFQRRSA